MALSLEDLNEDVRSNMLSEVERDVAEGTLYISARLNERGQEGYLALLREAIQSHDDSWLATNLRAQGYFNATYIRRKPSGGYTQAAMPNDAHETLAEGEFNRFYIRGLCLYAIQQGVSELEVYRAKAVARPRWESESRIGARVNPETLLNDVRTHPGVDTALGLPAGPNSGLSVRIPR
jgi:hypothetical protein